MPGRESTQVIGPVQGFIAVLVMALSVMPVTTWSQSVKFPVHQPVPGGIAVVVLDTSGADQVEARFGRRPVLLMERNQIWLGVIGLDLDMPLGKYVVSVRIGDEELSRSFQVKPQSYLFDLGGVKDPLPPDLISTAPWRPELDVKFPLALPVEARHLTPFGTSYPDGSEVKLIRAALLSGIENTEVVAPGNGIVSAVNTLEQKDTWVTIDHGMGLQSSLGPLENFKPGIGVSVQRGEVLGNVRTTADIPLSLSWEIRLNGAAVNPELVVGQLVVRDSD